MRSLEKKEAARRMNEWSACGVPFVFLIGYDMKECYVEKAEDISPSEMLYDFNGQTNIPEQRDSFFQIKDWVSYPVSYQEYRKSFDKVMDHIRAGNSFLTNLTCVTPLDTNLDLRQLFYQAVAPYKLCLQDRFVVFSPEIFVRIRNGYISSYPMKGTIDASLPNARSRILDDPKEVAEHATITDLIRNDLSMVAEEVVVKRYRYIDEVRTHNGTLLQVSSEISGRLPSDYSRHLGDILFSLLPAGSVTGAPKSKTISVIAEAETYSRGFYIGVTGYFDGKDLDSTVMIRFIERNEGRLLFKSGGGITCRSTPESEYEEMKQKVYVPIY